MGAELSLVWFQVHPSPTSPLHTSCKCLVTGPLSAALPPRRKWAAVLKKKKIMILPVSLMPDVMKVGGLLRQKVLVTVRGVLPMCACERQTKAKTDRGSQPGGGKREGEILASERVRAVHSICPAPGFPPGGG